MKSAADRVRENQAGNSTRLFTCGMKDTLQGYNGECQESESMRQNSTPILLERFQVVVKNEELLCGVNRHNPSRRP